MQDEQTQAGQLTVKERDEAERLIRAGLEEDLNASAGGVDITSQVVFGDAQPMVTGLLRARQPGVVAGLPVLPLLAQVDGQGVHFDLLTDDGPVEAGTAVAKVKGPARAVLTLERLALNLLGRLSGVASLTHQFVQSVQSTTARICDTRKTTPGHRYLEKYAVRVGGGTNQRIGLFDQVLIKDNHLAWLAKQMNQPSANEVVLAQALKQARQKAPPGMIIEIEVDSLTQLSAVLPHQPDIVLLDNMSPAKMASAVSMRDASPGNVQLEASGGIDLQSVSAIAQIGVDRISVGALTHSAPVFDIGLDDKFTPEAER